MRNIAGSLLITISAIAYITFIARLIGGDPARAWLIASAAVVGGYILPLVSIALKGDNATQHLSR